MSLLAPARPQKSSEEITTEKDKEFRRELIRKDWDSWLLVIDRTHELIVKLRTWEITLAAAFVGVFLRWQPLNKPGTPPGLWDVAPALLMILLFAMSESRIQVTLHRLTAHVKRIEEEKMQCPDSSGRWVFDDAAWKFRETVGHAWKSERIWKLLPRAWVGTLCHLLSVPVLVWHGALIVMVLCIPSVTDDVCALAMTHGPRWLYPYCLDDRWKRLCLVLALSLLLTIVIAIIGKLACKAFGYNPDCPPSPQSLQL